MQHPPHQTPLTDRERRQRVNDYLRARRKDSESFTTSIDNINMIKDNKQKVKLSLNQWLELYITVSNFMLCTKHGSLTKC